MMRELQFNMLLFQVKPADPTRSQPIPLNITTWPFIKNVCSRFDSYSSTVSSSSRFETWDPCKVSMWFVSYLYRPVQCRVCASSGLVTNRNASFNLPLPKERTLFSTSASADVNVKLKCKYLLTEMSRAFLGIIIKTEKLIPWISVMRMWVFLVEQKSWLSSLARLPSHSSLACCRRLRCKLVWRPEMESVIP